MDEPFRVFAEQLATLQRLATEHNITEGSWKLTRIDLPGSIFDRQIHALASDAGHEWIVGEAGKVLFEDLYERG